MAGRESSEIPSDEELCRVAFEKFGLEALIDDVMADVLALAFSINTYRRCGFKYGFLGVGASVTRVEMLLKRLNYAMSIRHESTDKPSYSSMIAKYRQVERTNLHRMINDRWILNQKNTKEE